MFELTNKVAVVTGASSGIGYEAAIAYAKAGADMAVLARRKDKLDDLASKINSLGSRAIAIQCDISKEEDVKKSIELILNNFKTIDILLNNAGIAVRGSVDTLTEEAWDLSMNTNLKGAFLMCKYVIPHMKNKRYGKIINIASENAFFADKADIAARHSYNTSKAGVIGLTTGMAATYAKYGITVNSICPGLFESEMTAPIMSKIENFEENYNAMCPMSRLCNKDASYGTILYFSSDASSYVTGQNIFVDGGISII